jgi:hypothetical protein
MLHCDLSFFCCDQAGEVMVNPDRPLKGFISAIRAAVVWSVGVDGALVCTDVANCPTHSSTKPPTPKVPRS